MARQQIYAETSSSMYTTQAAGWNIVRDIRDRSTFHSIQISFDVRRQMENRFDSINSN